MAHRVLIDLNILVDALHMREPYFKESARVLAAAEEGYIEGWLAAHTVTTLFYLIAKDTSPAAAYRHLTRLLVFLRIAPVDGRIIEQALALQSKDFEDAVQMMAGVRARLDYIVTRDRRGFQASPLPVLSPAELLALIKGGQ
jgi:predicted nucleic acid-binding protein